MALLVSLHINDMPIGLLNIHNLGGDFDGECEYEVTHHDDQGQRAYATFDHSRPEGALECVRKAIVALEGVKQSGKDTVAKTLVEASEEYEVAKELVMAHMRSLA